MLLTITTTHRPATDLGYLLHKHPDRCQTFDLNFGRAHVFYTEANDERCTAALLMELDSIGLVRQRRGPAGDGFSLRQYVNDRPYVASSFLSVAIAEVFGTALSGICKARPLMVDTPIALEAGLSVVGCRGGEATIRELFEPLGYEVGVATHVLDQDDSDWGMSENHSVRLRGTQRLTDLLSHLYVLIPVLDNDKHYWVGDDELEKLLRHGEGWLASHPAKGLISFRYLKHQRGLALAALDRLVEEESPHVDEDQVQHGREEERIEERISLHEQRLGTVVAALRQSDARRVLDLGCGEGKLLALLLKDPRFERIVGMDVSFRALQFAADRLKLDRLPTLQKDRIILMHGSLVYRDKRLEGFDAGTVIEVIEHLDRPRLAALERVLFEHARPQTVIVTTPNREYNVMWESLPAGQLRHKDHRFEWTRKEFVEWTTRVGARFGYAAEHFGIGPEDPAVGSPTQLAIFRRA